MPSSRSRWSNLMSEENVQDPAEETTAVAVEGEEGLEEIVEQIDPTGRLNQPSAGTFHWGTGRRKNAIARVRIRPGSGEFQVNGKALADYFPRDVDQTACVSPMTSLKALKKVDVAVNAHGGGITGQAGAVRMGLARALVELYPDAAELMRDHGHMTRDPRMVERKKYGRHGARRGHQWGKR